MYTIDEAKQWAEENHSELEESRTGCPDSGVRWFNRLLPNKSRELWHSGAWLGEKLRIAGATDKQVQVIQTAQGQRAFVGDPWQSAVDYMNEFLEQGDTEEKPGPELAEKIMKEMEHKPQAFDLHGKKI